MTTFHEAQDYWLRPRDVAVELGLSLHAVHALIRAGQLRAIQTIYGLRIPVEHVRAFIETSERKERMYGRS